MVAFSLAITVYGLGWLGCMLWINSNKQKPQWLGIGAAGVALVSLLWPMFLLECVSEKN
jgi:hypothetical protein